MLTYRTRIDIPDFHPRAQPARKDESTRAAPHQTAQAPADRPPWPPDRPGAADRRSQPGESHSPPQARAAPDPMHALSPARLARIRLRRSLPDHAPQTNARDSFRSRHDSPGPPSNPGPSAITSGASSSVVPRFRFAIRASTTTAGRSTPRLSPASIDQHRNFARRPDALELPPGSSTRRAVTPSTVICPSKTADANATVRRITSGRPIR